MPNNKNIILAAQQLQKMLGEKIHIVPSVNPMEGLAAAMAFMDNIGIEENLNEMSKRVQQIKTGMITAAVRDSLIGDIVIHKGDYMGITKDHQVFTEKDFNKCFRKLLESLIDEDTGVVTVYYGKDMSKDACGRELAAVEKIYSDIEFEMYDGGQPLYPMFISAE